jgi:hypothetical protein
MSPFEQNQKEIESLKGQIIELRTEDGLKYIGELLGTIVSVFHENETKYLHTVLILTLDNESVNFSWSNIKSIKKLTDF